MPESWPRTERFQAHCEEAWKSWRKRARRAKNEGRELPDLKDMAEVRNYLFIAIFICLLIPVIQVFTHWFDWTNPCEKLEALGCYCEYNRPWYAGLEVYGWALAGFFAVFAGVFDYSIWKRGGKSFIDW